MNFIEKFMQKLFVNFRFLCSRTIDITRPFAEWAAHQPDAWQDGHSWRHFFLSRSNSDDCVCPRRERHLCYCRTKEGSSDGSSKRICGRHKIRWEYSENLKSRYINHLNTKHLNAGQNIQMVKSHDLAVISFEYRTFWIINRLFSPVFRPPFKYRTIWQPDTNLPFEYKTSPVFR